LNLEFRAEKIRLTTLYSIELFSFAVTVKFLTSGTFFKDATRERDSLANESFSRIGLLILDRYITCSYKDQIDLINKIFFSNNDDQNYNTYFKLLAMSYASWIQEEFSSFIGKYKHLASGHRERVKHIIFNGGRYDIFHNSYELVFSLTHWPKEIVDKFEHFVDNNFLQ